MAGAPARTCAAAAVLLRRAGLDRCAQLIVGSAPASPDLLGRLRDLGVEVHDAYGLTEAPLVALNRHGRNRIGTVGEPLPQTSVRIAADGEVLVRGPQVTPGYVDAGMEQPFRDGWLATGDLGHLTADGFLVIDGRKKELLKTAYGKCLHQGRGDAAGAARRGRGDGGGRGAAVLRGPAVDRAARRRRTGRAGGGHGPLNARLEQPEQVRRWAVLPYDLTVEGGELTTNLKLRRTVVAERLGDVIASLYDQAPASAGGAGDEPGPAAAGRHVPAVARAPPCGRCSPPPRPGSAARSHRSTGSTPTAAAATRSSPRTRPRPPCGTGGPARAPGPAGARRRVLGARLRAGLRLRTTEDAMAAARVVYGLLDIDLRGTRDGEITVRRCPFSDVYSAEVCRLVGALDSACWPACPAATAWSSASGSPRAHRPAWPGCAQGGEQDEDRDRGRQRGRRGDRRP